MSDNVPMDTPIELEKLPARSNLWRRAILAIALLALLATAIPTAFSFLARLHWTLDNLTAFVIQYAVASAGLLALFLLLRCWRGSLVAALLLSANVARLDPFSREATSPTTSPLKIVTANVNFGNPQHDRLLRFLEETDPDIVVVPELAPHWADALQAVRDRWPHAVVMPQGGAFGIGLYSKLPFQNSRTVDSSELHFPSIIVQVTHGNVPLTIIGTHPPPPNSARAARLRNQQFADLAALVREAGGEVVLLGDLNVSPWSPYFRDLLRDGNLRDSRSGLDPQATWPAGFPPLFKTPIDHVLISPGLAVVSRRIGPKIGSDHLPVIAEIAVLRKP